jgi:membrane-associated phospholipid phosphatase
VKLAAEAAARLVILLVLLAVLLWLAVWTARRLYRLLSPHATVWLQAGLRWADVHPKIGRIAQALADPAHPDAATLAALAASLIGSTAVLGISIGAGLFGAPDLAINQITLDLAQSLHTPLADHIMAGLARLGDPLVTATLTLAVLLYLSARGHRRDAGYWLAAALFGLVATPTLGWLLQVPRPALGLDLRWPWSFPSGPALSATLIYGFLAVTLSRAMSQRRRWTAYAAATVLIGAVALARLYFGTEWLTDLIGSVALGLVWIAALGLALHRHTRPIPHWAGLGGVALIGATLAFTAASLLRHERDIAALMPQPPPCSISAARWRAREDLPVAQHREDLWRRNQRPFDLQFAGQLDALVTALAPSGWQRAEMLDWGNALKLLSPSLPLAELPVIRHVHDGRHEALALVKDPAPDQRLVLRLWSAHCRIDGGFPLWVGDVTSLRKDNIVDLLALPITVTSPDPSGAALEWDLKQAQGLDADPGWPLLMATGRSGLLAD